MVTEQASIDSIDGREGSINAFQLTKRAGQKGSGTALILIARAPKATDASEACAILF